MSIFWALAPPCAGASASLPLAMPSKTAAPRAGAFPAQGEPGSHPGAAGAGGFGAALGFPGSQRAWESSLVLILEPRGEQHRSTL